MGKIANEINVDLKKSMLAGDKENAGILRDLKSAILYFGVENGNRDSMSDEQEMSVLRKESKKRTDAIELYKKGGDTERYKQEEKEKTIIDSYLPKMMEQSDVVNLIEKAASENGGFEQANMGKIIGQVKAESAGLADGSLIARLVKERIAK